MQRGKPNVPSSEAIERKEWPCSRRDVILPGSTTLRGLPSVFLLARAFRSPARTRSTIKLRSSSATALNRVKPAGSRSAAKSSLSATPNWAKCA
jgi:hypothetical protein